MKKDFFYNFNQDWCNLYPCYYDDRLLIIFDLIIISILPCLLILFFNITLLIRVVWMKNIRLNRIVQWRKYRKMTIQLLSISTLFILFYLPLMIYYLLYIFQWLSLVINPQIELYLTFIAYFSILFLPFVTLFSLHNDYWRNQWRKLIRFIRTHRSNVHPIVIDNSNAIELRRVRTS